MIILKGISVQFAGKSILAGVDWTIPPGERVGMVGDNGAGKTTLLRLMVGESLPESGTVEVGRGETLGYLPQDLAELPAVPLLDYLKDKGGILELERELSGLEQRINAGQADPGDERRFATLQESYRIGEGPAFPAAARRVLRGLGFAPGDEQRSCATFSGGWKMRVALAGLLLMRPTILLLDEPTNHLDTESMEWLESYLKDYPGTMIAVSHDRTFLDKTVRRIAEVSGGKVTLFAGNYTRYEREREARLDQLRRQWTARRSEIARAQEFIDRFRAKATKAAAVQSRIKMLEGYEELPEIRKERQVTMRFPEADKGEAEVFVLTGVGQRFGDNQVFSGLDLVIRRGERLALIGVNGAGKTTLSRILSGRLVPTSGTVQRGERIRIGYYSQESAAELDYRRTVWEEAVAAGGKADDLQRRNLLGAFLFSGDDVQKKVEVLSGGEKSRLALLRLLLQASNCLILDEPTNHLDSKTREVFQRALRGYGGTVVIVSHDRSFLDSMVTRILELREGSITDYPGNYSEFIARRAGQPVAPVALQTGTVAEGSAPDGLSKKELRRLEAERRSQTQARRRAVQKEISFLEGEVAALETEKSTLENSLCDPAFLADSSRIGPAMVAHKRVSETLKQRMAVWEEKMARLEEIDREAALPVEAGA